MLFALCAFLLMSLGIPASSFGTFLFAAGCIPFLLDASINLYNLGRPSTATVEEIHENSEYRSMNDAEDKNFVDPSERILPRSIRENNTLHYLLTSNWKDNAANVEETSVQKQMTAFTMLLAFLFLGGAAIVSGNGPAVGTMSLLYGGSGLVGYLGFKLPPLFRAISVNATSGLCAVMALGAMASGGLSLSILMLTALHIIDLMQGA
jgi:hypothetical protein